MIDFAWPWLFLFLPLPLAARAWLPAAPPREAALRVPFLDDFPSPDAPRRQGSGRARLWLAALAWLLLVGAAARPQWVGEAVEIPASGRDLMLAVDLSGSMRMEDFTLHGQTVDRLTATKAVAGQFIERRKGDRLGLILFGEQAYLQTPLTFDHATLSTLLDEAVIGLAGEKTAIGDAIGVAVKRLRGEAAESRVLILLTDGANTAGAVEPLKAAELAADAGLKIYTIGIGADELLIPSFFGSRRINPSAELDEKALQGIAERTGGRYFRARDTAELEKIYSLLDRLEPVAGEGELFRPVAALFAWPLAGALLLAGALAAGSTRRRA